MSFLFVTQRTEDVEETVADDDSTLDADDLLSGDDLSSLSAGQY